MNENLDIGLLRKAVEWAEVEAAKPFELCEWDQTIWVEESPTEAVYSVERVSEYFNIGSTPTNEDGFFTKSPDCGTCYCIAGWVAANTLNHGESIRGGDRVVDKDGNTHDIEMWAAEKLGVSHRAVYDLFSPSNTIEDVRRLAEDLAGERL